MLDSKTPSVPQNTENFNRRHVSTWTWSSGNTSFDLSYLARPALHDESWLDSPVDFISGGESLAKSLHEGQVALGVMEGAAVRDKPVKLSANMLLIGRWLLTVGLNCYMFPYKQAVSDYNESAVHASRSAARCSFSLHSVETCGTRERERENTQN